MAERGQYSLKELLYWLTVWSAGLGGLVAVIPETVFVIYFAVWFIGTTVVSKGFGYRAGFWYSAFFGVVFCLLMDMLTTPMSNKSPQPRFAWDVTFVLLFGIGFGSFVWAVGVGFDRLFRFLSRSD
jgi:uncharacterized membrane protein YagU involved in acid resistance